MTEFKQDDRCYLAVEVPEGASEFKFNPKDCIWWLIGESNDNECLPDGNYSIIGIASKLTEEQAKEMVESWDSPTGGGDYQDYYKNYSLPEDDIYGHDYYEPIQSLKSRLTSLKLSDNVLIIQKL